MPDAKTIRFYDTAADRYANLTKTTKPDQHLSDRTASANRLPPKRLGGESLREATVYYIIL